MLQRRCVGCGLRADSSRVDVSARDLCPRCGMDWSQRPPQSYAELEGFAIDEVVEAEPESGPAVSPSIRGRTRALRVLEVGLFVLLIVTALVVASANIVAALRGTGGAM
ncbi:hypothetical protein ABWH91_05715 [Phycisphaerales bacterium ac7]